MVTRPSRLGPLIPEEWARRPAPLEDDPWPVLAFVPGVLALAFLFCAGDIGSFLAHFVGMPFHECGHAAASWLGAHPALPLPFFTFWWEERSFWAGALLLILLGVLGRACWRERCYFAVTCAGAAALWLLVLGVLVPARTSSMVQILGGPYGELVLPSLVLTLFYFRLPAAWRWDFWRFPLALPASLALAQAFFTWNTAAHNLGALPFGSALGDPADGDLDRLVAHYGWTTEELARTGRTIGWSCLGALTLTMAWVAARNRWNARVT
jgi:hypothetical protein